MTKAMKVLRFAALAGALALPLLGLAVGGASTPALAGEGAAMDGKEIFLGEKCNMCHSVSTADIEAKTKSEKMFGGDLVDLEHEADWIAEYLKKAAEKDGSDHKREFKGTDEELAALVDWLLAQKTS